MAPAERELRVDLQPLYLPESMHAFKVLEQFKQSRTHIALVLNEINPISQSNNAAAN
jgi:CBS domain containing-hemolysin-like protein